MKTVTIRDLVQKGASKVFAAAESSPFLVTRNGEPAAWIIGANWLREASGGRREIYDQALIGLAIALYEQDALSMGRAAELSGLPMADFMMAAGRLGVSTWRLTPEDLAEQVESLERLVAPNAGEAAAGSVAHQGTTTRITVRAEPDTTDEREEDPYLFRQDELVAV